MKIVFTGGTCVGKTSLVEALSQRGHRIVPEAGLQIISELNELWGIDKQKQWRVENPQDFYRKIVDRQLELERSAISSGRGLVFLDRGILDYLAFLKLVDEEVRTELRSLALSCHYDLGFLCNPFGEFSARTNSGRSLDKVASDKLDGLISGTYAEFGCQLLNLPSVSIEDRLNLIEKEVGKSL